VLFSNPNKRGDSLCLLLVQAYSYISRTKSPSRLNDTSNITRGSPSKNLADQTQKHWKKDWIQGTTHPWHVNSTLPYLNSAPCKQFGKDQITLNESTSLPPILTPHSPPPKLWKTTTLPNSPTINPPTLQSPCTFLTLDFTSHTF